MFIIQAKSRLKATKQQKDLNKLSDSTLRKIANDKSDPRSSRAKSLLKTRSKTNKNPMSKGAAGAITGLGALGLADVAHGAKTALEYGLDPVGTAVGSLPYAGLALGLGAYGLHKWRQRSKWDKEHKK